MNVFSSCDSVIDSLNKSDRKELAMFYSELVKNDQQTKEIPKFYTSDNKDSSKCYQCSFSNILTNLAIGQSFRSIIDSYPSYEDVQNLRDAYQKMPKILSPRVIKYTQYKQLRQQWPERLQPILTSRLFVEIGGHLTHTINADELFNRLDIFPRCVNHFVRLNQYDFHKNGSIEESNFKDYVADMSNNLNFIEQQAQEYPEFQQKFIDYVSTLIFTVLDPLRTGKVLVSELIRNSFYLNFVMLESPSDNIESNYFSPNMTLKYINEFNEIDHDGDGYLSQDDLYSIPNTRFTKAFIDRVFVTTTTNGPTNFCWYIRFRFMWDMFYTKWANQMMFDIFDVDGDGKITFFEINYFYKEIKNIPDIQIPPFESWSNEFFDSFGATDCCITKSMFVNMQIAQTLRQLADINVFINSEHTEY